MTEPPKPFSSDDVAPKPDIEGWHAAEESIDDLLGGDMEDFKQVAEDAKKRSMGAEMKNVVWIRCEHCGEMKDENVFKKYKNGTLAKACNACIGSKIRDAKAKRIEKLAPMIEQKQIYIGVDKARDTSDMVVTMKIDIFHAANGMAYERGLKEGKTFANMTITEFELPVIINEVLGVRV